MGTPDMGMVIRAGKLWTTWGKIEACMTRKENAGEESPTDPCCRVWSHPAFLPSSRAYYKKENERFMNKWVQTEKIIK